MKLHAIALGFGALFLAPSALACTDASLQEVANLYAAADQPGADFNRISTGIATAAGPCPADPHVLRLSTMAEAKMAEKSTAPLDRLTHAADAWAWYRKFATAYVSTATPPRTVNLPAGPAQVVLYGSYEMGVQLLTGLFTAEVNAGKLSPYSEKRAPGAPPDSCDDYNYSLTAQLFLRERGNHVGAYNVLDRGIEACEARIAKGDMVALSRLTTRARALIESVQRTPKPANAAARLIQARADADRFLLLNKRHSIAYWQESEDRALNTLLGKEGVVTENDWFKAEYLGNEAVVKAMAAQLDRAWRASEAAGGINAGFKPFRDALAPLYARANQAANPDAAKKMVALAARGVSDGSLRSAPNAALPPIPVYLWNWIHPDVKPAP